MMDVEKLREWAAVVIADYDCAGTDCDCDRPKNAALARAAQVLADLLPVLREWAGPLLRPDDADEYSVPPSDLALLKAIRAAEEKLK